MTNNLIQLLPAVAAFLVSLVTVGIGIRLANKLGLIDTANHRSLHVGEKPRTGGLGLFAGVAVGWFLAAFLVGLPEFFTVLIVAIVLIGAVSLIDDRIHVPAAWRFGVHVVASIVFSVFAVALESIQLPGVSIAIWPPLGIALTVLLMVWFTNLFNFMDGMDGFAGGMALIGFASLAVAGAIQDQFEFAAATAVIALAAGGFLCFNFPPARVFLGDSGSAPLGFLVAAFGVWADAEGVLPFWATLLIFSPFFVDATITLIRRLAQGARFWEAHREHYYQILVQSGWSHRRTALVEYVVMLGSGLAAVASLFMTPAFAWSIIGGWLVFYALVAVWIDRSRRHRL
jgi:UDP-N-acetylmuramyl pentapeptide phosphotransferase/UDP-N-acetylglucosamine-1-phosphate transferase